MRVLYFSKEESNFMWQWQRSHIFDELAHHDCYFEVLNPLFFSSWDLANEKLLSTLKDNCFDLVMTPYGDGGIYISTLKEIKKTGIPTLLFCPDNNTIPFYYKNVSIHFDLVWLTSKDTEYLFKKWGAKTIFLPYAANPYLFNPKFGEEIEKVCFIGNTHGTRPMILNTLLDANIELCLFSKKSNNDSPVIIKNEINLNTKLKGTSTLNYLSFEVGRKILLSKFISIVKKNKLMISSPTLEIRNQIPFDEINQTYNKYALSISSITARNTAVLKKPAFMVNLRSFEIPMCGGLQICQHSSELSNYFEEDKEILFYRSNEEFVDKAKFYLRSENHSIRLKMKSAARKRAENEHTWYCRFVKIIKELEIKL